MDQAQQEPTRNAKTIHDILSIVGFVAAIWLGAFLLNSFVFQIYTVNGVSMEETLRTNDRLLVNKLPVTGAHLAGKQYIPERGSIIVFENPLPELRKEEAFIVKRVIGLPNEGVVVKNGEVTVFNQVYPEGFDPDEEQKGLQLPTEGDVEITVPENELFVVGDNRISQHSFDSRNGLSTIPTKLIQGKVVARVFPLNRLRGF